MKDYQATLMETLSELLEEHFPGPKQVRATTGRKKVRTFQITILDAERDSPMVKMIHKASDTFLMNITCSIFMGMQLGALRF